MTVIGAGAIALAPVQPVQHLATATPQKVASQLAVNLAASIDPITPLVEMISTSWSNIVGLNQTYWANPAAPTLTAILSNQYTYFQEFPDISKIISQVTGNLKAAWLAPSAIDPDNPAKYISDAPNSTPGTILCGSSGSNPCSHQDLFQFMAVGLSDQPKLLKVLADLGTPIAGLLLGFAGPGLSAMLQIRDSVNEIFHAPNFMAGINALINMPTAIMNAGLNGGPVLDVLPILKKLGLTLPASVKTLNITTGGLLNAGGAAFNAVGTHLDVESPITLDQTWTGIPVGLLGSLTTVLKVIGQAIYLPPPNPGAAVQAAAVTPRAAAATVAEAPAPVVADAPAAPVAEAPAPVAEAPAPVVEAPAPVVEAPAPAAPSAPAADAPASAPVSVSDQNDAPEAPAPSRQIHRGQSAASSDNSGSASDNTGRSASRAKRAG